MKKKLFFIILFSLLFTPTINATIDAYINGNTVRIRQNAGTDSSIITTLNVNTDVTLDDKTLYEGTGCSEKWYKINYNNKTGYVCSKYVTFKSNIYTGINVIDWTSRVNANNVAVRSGTSTSYSSLDTLTLGTNVTILSEHSGSSSKCSSGKWYKIKYYSNSTGYICSNYITNKSDITDNDIDSDYKSYLDSQGFPESYQPYLNYLHKKYPNWVFVAGKTNLDFTTSVNKESGKNYMQTTNDNYRTSSSPAEGKSWFNVNTGVIAFYMDPRNWFNEERIFMFESLKYDNSLESVYPTLVKNIFGSGALGDAKYVGPIISGSKANGLSPVYVAGRIRQEVGANGSDSTNGTSFTYMGNTYSGYYNFFNIGAYESTIDGVKYSSVTMGLVKAMNNGWNTIEKAITEGSTFLSNGYVSKGQATGYYQKFNVGPDAYYSKYTHQYMTNIQAPATEANTAYNSYANAELLNTSFVFEIPVYNNMPSYVSLPNSGDAVNTLSNLEVEGYSLSPSFDEDVLTYESYVSNKIDKINIKAYAASSKATVEGTGEKEIKDDETLFTITVTSESGITKKYTITVIKVEDTTKASDVVQKSNNSYTGNVITNISRNTTVSEYKNNMIKNGAQSVTIMNNNSTMSDNNKLVTGSTITIKTAIDTQNYTLSITGDTSGDGEITILDLLQIQKHLIGSSTISGAKYYAADTSKDGNVTILDLLQVQKYLKGERDL